MYGINNRAPEVVNKISKIPLPTRPTRKVPAKTLSSQPPINITLTTPEEPKVQLAGMDWKKSWFYQDLKKKMLFNKQSVKPTNITLNGEVEGESQVIDQP